MSIAINIIHGNRDVGADDLDRARDAALKVLSDAGVSADAAFAEFRRQWDHLETDEAIDAGLAQDYTHLTGLAVLWVRAEVAANAALTAGWARPDGAACGISA